MVTSTMLNSFLNNLLISLFDNNTQKGLEILKITFLQARRQTMEIYLPFKIRILETTAYQTGPAIPVISM